MQRTKEGETLEVPIGETFVIERRSLAGGGARTLIKTPDGITHVGSRDPEPTDSFGGRPLIEERFRCTKAGKFDICFESGRPWEATTLTVVTHIICR